MSGLIFYERHKEMNPGITRDFDLAWAKIAAIRNVLEYGTPRLKYTRCDVVEGLAGGPAALKFGYAGFRTNESTGLQVVQAAIERSAIAAALLEPYLPRLMQLASTNEESIAGLEGFAGVWERIGALPDVVEAQEWVDRDEWYFSMLLRAQRRGWNSPLARAILYDSIREDGLELVDEAISRLPYGGFEAGELDEFLSLDSPSARVSAWRSLVEARDWNLELPLTVAGCTIVVEDLLRP